MNNTIRFENLSDTEAIARLAHFGPNELPESKSKSIWLQIIKTLQEPMLLLLLIATGIYFILGDLGESLLLGLSVFMVIGISFYQEYKSEKALAALQELSSPQALVIRSDREQKIQARLLVPGDLVILHEGARVPADGIILESSHLSLDESLLTGEAFPVQKTQIQKNINEFSFDSLENKFKVFSSTLVVSGKAIFRVTRTGLQTEVGKIGKSLLETEPDELNLNKEIRQMVRTFAWSGALICIAIIIFYGLSSNNWIEAFLIGLATQMALLPEEFPVILTIFLALGAWRLSRLQVLIRRPGSIERLGAITVLCVDKTGTLTQNQMSVVAIDNFQDFVDLNPQEIAPLDENFHRVLEFGVLASHRDPFDPMEKAIRKTIADRPWGKDHLHQSWELIRDYPLSNNLLAMSCVWKNPNTDSFVIATKGAPEAIIDLCHLDQIKTEKILEATKKMANRGLRVLGIAKASLSQNQLPTSQHEFAFEWIGLIGLEDPLRPEVPAAIQLCRQAGIRVIMMTGDYPETALNIAKKSGLETRQSLITGTELQSLSDQELNQRLQTAHIFARTVPEQKLRVVKLLKNLGHVVAMTGDGVNDAPSLKWADVGIAMGARGTDVAREASDMILMDDNFSSIVGAIKRGRLIFNNIRKAVSYVISIHIPIAGLCLLPILFKWPLILLPVHTVFLELIIDPTCSLLFESQATDRDIMHRPPRPLTSRLFRMRDFWDSLFQGILILSVIAGMIWYSVNINHDSPDRTRAFAFIILILSNLGLVFADMSDGSPRQLAILLKRTSNQMIILGLIGILIFITQISGVQSLFHFGPIQIKEFLLPVGISTLVFILISGWKKIVSYYCKN